MHATAHLRTVFASSVGRNKGAKMLQVARKKIEQLTFDNQTLKKLPLVCTFCGS